MKFAIFSLIALFLATAHSEELYAILTAGSKEFYNYRHQNDICHGYNVLIRSGLKPENIIVMSYDDVASSSENPFPGKLFPRPGTNVPDTHEGCKIDYKAKDVTPANWMKVVKGDAAGMKGIGTGRVLPSTENDYVFIYFEDHGGEGLICFPEADLYADDLLKTLQAMHDGKKYKKLNFFLSACESGSMFEKLNVPGVFGMTSANPHQSAYAVYCPPNDELVNGKHIGACLGSEFSVRWEELAESMDMSKITLGEQVAKIKTLTKQSEACLWGDQTFFNLPASTFVGHIPQTANLRSAQNPDNSAKCFDRDIKLAYLLNKVSSDLGAHDQKDAYIKLQRELDYRNFIDSTFDYIAKKFEINLSEEYKVDTNWECFKDAMDYWKNKCGRLTEYGLKMTTVMKRYCMAHESFDGIRDEIGIIC